MEATHEEEVVSREQKKLPPYLLRLQDGTPPSIEFGSTESSVWNLNKRSEVKSFNPRFENPLPLGSVIEIPMINPAYYLVDKPNKGQELPQSVYAVKVPRPADIEELRKKGQVFQPDNLPIELKK